MNTEITEKTVIPAWVVIAFFWLARLTVQLAVFDGRDFLKNGWLRAGYHCLTLAFVCPTTIYGWAALAGKAVRL